MAHSHARSLHERHAAAWAGGASGARHAPCPSALSAARQRLRMLPRTAACGAAAAAACGAAAAACSASTAAAPLCLHPAPWVTGMQQQQHRRRRHQPFIPHAPCGAAAGLGAPRGVAARAAREVSTAEAGQPKQQQQQAGGAGAEQGEQQQEEEGQEEGQQQQADAQQGKAGARRAPRYSPLHHNIEDFCRRVVPTHDERAAKQRVIDVVTSCTRKGLEGLPLPEGARTRVQPFGSFVSGLSTWNSDVDIVISGLVTPSRLTGGFGQADKRFVAKVLERVAKEMRRSRRIDLRSLVIIRTARIPIIKLQTGPAYGSVVADISLGDDSGPAAARYVTQQIAAYPPLAPLVLVLKVYLRRCGLNEVANGGLSSYSLTLMVLAHLQEEIKAGNDVFDLGEALYGFLLRYGEEFDYAGDAVSVASGGMVPKVALGAAGYESASSGSFDDGSSWGGRERLMVDDPLTGRDISAGTYRVDDLRLAFGRAARRLEALARGRRDATTNYLQGLFEVEAALVRGPKDLHGQHFPGEAGPGGAPRAARRGGRGGAAGRGGGAPREVILTEEYDLEEQGGDDLWWDDAGGSGGGSGAGGGRGRARRR